MSKPDFGYFPIVRWISEQLSKKTCETCNGTGEIETTIGGDGYGGRCCGEMDVPTSCPDCQED